jgi:hypothetical protein
LQQLYPQPAKPADVVSEPSRRLRRKDPPDEVDADTMARITGPLSEYDAADRSAAFHNVVRVLFHANHSIEEIVALMEPHPDGVAKRYIAEGRLPKMVELSFNKFRGEEEIRGAIDKLNEQYFVVKIGAQTLIGELRPSLRLTKVQDFHTWLANQRIIVQGPRGGMKVKPLSNIWLTDPGRRQFEGVDLVPGGEEVLPNGYLNLWRGFGVQPKQGAWPLMMRHVIYVLAAGDRNAAEYILKKGGRKKIENRCHHWFVHGLICQIFLCC